MTDAWMSLCTVVVYAEVMRESKAPGARSKVRPAQRPVTEAAHNPARPLAASAAALASEDRGMPAPRQFELTVVQHRSDPARDTSYSSRSRLPPTALL